MFGQAPHDPLVLFLTNFGDLAVAMPVALCAALFFYYRDRGDLALIYGLNVVLAIAAATVLKLIFAATDATLWQPVLGMSNSAPSGHVVDAVAVYGGLAVLVGLTSRGLARFVLGLFAVALITCVSVTRIIIGAHTPGDVVAGLIVGAAAVALIGVACRRGAPTTGGFYLVLLLIAVTGFMQFTGIHLSSVEYL
jgi:membrane-associated phospholipid phosphatase